MHTRIANKLNQWNRRLVQLKQRVHKYYNVTSPLGNRHSAVVIAYRLTNKRMQHTNTIKRVIEDYAHTYSQ